MCMQFEIIYSSGFVCSFSTFFSFSTAAASAARASASKCISKNKNIERKNLIANLLQPDLSKFFYFQRGM